MRRLFVALALFLAVTCSVLAITDYVIPLEVRSQVNDPIGGNLVEALQAEIKRTSYIRPAGPGEKRLVLYIQTIRYSPTVTVYGAAWTLQSDETTPPLFLSLRSNWTGGGAVHQAAVSLIEYTDQVYQHYRGLF